jgi:ATP-dependent RNA helicase DOB1
MHGALSTLTAIQAASVLSCFVWSEPSERGNPKIREELQGAYGALREAAKRVGTAQVDAGMPCDIEGFVSCFRPDLMDMVTLWASGARFAEVCIQATPSDAQGADTHVALYGRMLHHG